MTDKTSERRMAHKRENLELKEANNERRQKRSFSSILHFFRQLFKMERNASHRLTYMPEEEAKPLPITPMFGGRLEDSLDEETGVATFVVWCVNAIEQTGDKLNTDAIYRASGNKMKITRLTETVEKDMIEALQSEDNIHVLTGALKTFFRKLQEPVLDLEDCVDCFSESDDVARCHMFQLLVLRLAPANRNTLEYILRHLLKVVELKTFNNMSARSVAIVFGPNLISASDKNTTNSEQQNSITEFLLLNFSIIFTKEEIEKRQANSELKYE